MHLRLGSLGMAQHLYDTLREPMETFLYRLHRLNANRVIRFTSSCLFGVLTLYQLMSSLFQLGLTLVIGMSQSRQCLINDEQWALKCREDKCADLGAGLKAIEELNFTSLVREANTVTAFLVGCFLLFLVLLLLLVVHFCSQCVHWCKYRVLCSRLTITALPVVSKTWKLWRWTSIPLLVFALLVWYLLYFLIAKLYHCSGMAALYNRSVQTFQRRWVGEEVIRIIPIPSLVHLILEYTGIPTREKQTRFDT